MVFRCGELYVLKSMGAALWSWFLVEQEASRQGAALDGLDWIRFLVRILAG